MADERLEAALTEASDAMGLQVWYRDCVRPLIRMPEEQWPSCCGGQCEPCNQVLVEVARMVRTKLDAAHER